MKYHLKIQEGVKEMAEKKAAKTKKPVEKATVKTKASKQVSKGDSYACEVCGLAVTVEEVGNIAYIEESPIICCDIPMKKRKARAKSTK